MKQCTGKPTRAWAQLTGAVVMVLVGAVTPASAQRLIGSQPFCPPTPCPLSEGILAPTTPSPTPSTTPPGQLTPPTTTAPTDTSTSTPEAPTPPSSLAGAVGTEGLAAVAPGYIDYAIPMTQFRFRFDSAYDDNRPDRAEFFYPKCGCFRLAGLDPHAPGPPLVEPSIDYQEYWFYGEYAFTNRFSVFFEAPIVAINPEANQNASGCGDINAGFKLALIADEGQYLTFQFRTYFPTGDPGKGLGTDHFSLEPALLFHTPLTDKLAFDSEFHEWIAIPGTDFSGNVLRYGLGFSYLLFQEDKLRFTPIAEVVGWTVLTGKELDGLTGETLSASGNTIVNAKMGLRTTFKDQSSLYVGYGRALTGTVWYKDILRVEYQLAF